MELPVEIWKYEIYTYLDYNSKINLNRVLKHELRGKTKMKKQDIISHIALCIAPIIKNNLLEISTQFPLFSKFKGIKALFEKLQNPFIQQIFNFKKFKETALIKCSEFYDSNLLIDEDKKELNLLIDNVRKIAESHLFEFDGFNWMKPILI